MFYRENVMRTLEVAIAAPISSTLNYTAETLLGPNGNSVGRRVLVPLGGRKVTGYVISECKDVTFDFPLKEIHSFLDDFPLFQENQIPFFQWIATYYHHPIGMVIKTALPSGLTSGSVNQIALCTLPHGVDVHWQDHEVKEPDWYAALLRGKMLSPAMSRKILATSQGRKELSILEAKGIAGVINLLQGDKVKEKEENCIQLSKSLTSQFSLQTESAFEEFYSRIKETVDTSLKLSEAKTLYHLSRLSIESGNQTIPQKELNKKYPGARKAILGLGVKKHIIRSKKRVYRNPFGEQLSYYPRPSHLSKEQNKVIKIVTAAIEKKEFSPFLLHGVTGSGKTEVYLQAAEKTIAQGRDVIVLVPEIALATQLESHFVSRFEGLVVLQHSGLSAGEKLDQWTLALQGKAKIVIGARSAIFAPLKNPGLIIVDEEHDHGFKQDDNLHYQGRDVAVLRASMQGAVVILGSATPSVTSYFHAQEGKYRLLEMGNRIGGRSLPEVQLVDLSKKSNKNPKSKVIRSELRQALEATLKAGQQSLLLLNRRGFSGTYLCQECGTTIECVHCHVSLTLHRREQLLVCHYCGYTLTAKTLCPSCHSTQLVPVGFGTERIEEEIYSLFPEARIARLDSDTAKNRKNFTATLKKMHQREIDILIGTQMIAKGHHFPGVTLVGVVWADAGLNMPDFRASERVYQLISQVTGRAGRGESPGRVIIQTMRPDHYALQHARKHQYKSFYHDEINTRRAPSFPPLVRLVAIRVTGEKEHEVRNTAHAIVQNCRKCIASGQSGIEILGPAPCPLDRLVDKFRWQILLRAQRVDELHVMCKWLLENSKHIRMGRVKMSIDVDPENMM